MRQMVATLNPRDAWCNLSAAKARVSEQIEISIIASCSEITHKQLIFFLECRSSNAAPIQWVPQDLPAAPISLIQSMENLDTSHSHEAAQEGAGIRNSRLDSSEQQTTEGLARNGVKGARKDGVKRSYTKRPRTASILFTCLCQCILLALASQRFDLLSTIFFARESLDHPMNQTCEQMRTPKSRLALAASWQSPCKGD